MIPHPTCQRTFSVIEYLYNKGEDTSTDALVKILPYREKDTLAYIVQLVRDGCIDINNHHRWYPKERPGEVDD